MARRGSFGRVPRYAASLASTIISITREMQTSRDNNLLDAWKSGGLFEGKPVTDDDILAHWRERMAGVDKSDPMYDTYQNAYMQYDYAINESRMSTRYAKGQIGDAAMGQFYINWSKKVPKDSEFYRVLQRDGAQFMRVAKSKSEAAAKKAAEERYQNQLKGMHDKDQAAGEYLLTVATEMASAGYASAGIQPLIGATGSGIDNFDPSDPEQMLRLMSLISPATAPGGSTAVLYHDENGKPVTGAEIVAKLKGLDPTFDGNVTPAYFSDKVKQMRDSIGEQEALATKTGHASDAEALSKRKSTVAELGREINAWPVQGDYLDAYNEYALARSNPYMAPTALMEAWRKYQGTLVKLANDPRIATDDATRSRLMGEANLVDGQPTLAESFTGLQNGEPTATGNIANNRMVLEDTEEQIQSVASGESLWTQGDYGKDDVFTPRAGGPSIGAATREQVAALSPSGTAEVVYVPSGDGKTMTPIHTVAGEVNVVATDPRTGKAVALTRDAPVATVRVIYINGRPIEEYGFKAADGITRYTTDPIWGPGVQVRREGGGLVLDVSALIPADTTQLSGGDLGGGWRIGGKTAESVDKKTGERKGANPGGYVMDPLAVLMGTAPDRWAAGADPMTDFVSPSLPILLDPRVPEGHENLYQLRNDPNFMAQLQHEARVAAGFHIDPAAPDGSGYSGGDAAKFATIMDLQDVSTRKSYISMGEGDFVSAVNHFWDRESTQPLISGATWRTAKPIDKRDQDRNLDKLPLDQLKGTPFEPLGNVTKDGTNLFTPALSEATGFNLKLGQKITVPAVGVQPTAAPTSTTTAPTPGISTGVPGASSSISTAVPGMSAAQVAERQRIATRSRIL